MAVTIYDVAREAGVSMATVSRVINGNIHVKPETRRKVTECIEKLGYRPNEIARGLASRKTTTVGVIVPDISKTFYGELSRGIFDIATMYEYNIILSNSDERVDREVDLINDYFGKQVEGVILMSDSISDEVRSVMANAPVPVVLAGTIDEEKQFPTVNIDYEEASYLAVKKLIENGHKQIVFLSGPFTSDINLKHKRVGYERALKDSNIEINESFIIETDDSYDSAYETWKTIQKLPEKPTAIFAGNGALGVGVLNGIRDAGLAVPNDYEIICFEHSNLVRIVRPQISSVVVPLYDLGAVAMRLLTKLMKKEEVELEHVILPFGIQSRDSTK